MCLAIPGRVEQRFEGPGGVAFALVRFGAVTQEVCVAFVPDVVVGEYVIVHVGFAIQKLDERAARQALSLLSEAVSSEERA